MCQSHQRSRYVHPFCHPAMPRLSQSFLFLWPSLIEKHVYTWQSQKCHPEILSPFHMKSLLLTEVMCLALHNNHTRPMWVLSHHLTFSHYLPNSSPPHSTKCTTQLSAPSSMAMILFQELQQQRITRDLRKYKDTNYSTSIKDENKGSMDMYIASVPPEQFGFTQLCWVPQVDI